MEKSRIENLGRYAKWLSESTQNFRTKGAYINIASAFILEYDKINKKTYRDFLSRHMADLANKDYSKEALSDVLTCF